MNTQSKSTDATSTEAMSTESARTDVMHTGAVDAPSTSSAASGTQADQATQVGKFVAGAALGALVMYLLDPERGRSRRTAAVDTLREVSRGTTHVLDEAVRDLRHRAGAADVFHASDSEIQRRDSSGAAGYTAAASRAVESAARSLIPQSLSTVFSQPASDISTIAKGLRERSWDPQTRSAARNAALWGGGALGLLSLVARRSPLTMAVGLAGAAMLARGATGRPLSSLVPREMSGPVEIEKTIRIDASPEQVYDMWAKYENFPRFMSHVVEVRDLGANLSHWVVKGPLGTTFEWESILTEQSRPHRLSWRTVPGSEVEHRGEVWLEAVGGGTRATVRMTYTPPAGIAGQALATLLGSNPAAQLEHDLQRLKTLLERGTLPHAAAQIGSSTSKFLH